MPTCKTCCRNASRAFDVFSMCVIAVIQFDARLQSLLAQRAEKLRNETTRGSIICCYSMPYAEPHASEHLDAKIAIDY